MVHFALIGHYAWENGKSAFYDKPNVFKVWYTNGDMVSPACNESYREFWL